MLSLLLLALLPPGDEAALRVMWNDWRGRRPLDFQMPPDGSGRVFIVEQGGEITVFDSLAADAQHSTFLEIDVRRRNNEEGLLGMAFAPDYAASGHFYLNYSDSKPRRSVLSQWQVDGEDPDRADPGSEQVLVQVAQPYGNHNGGGLAFGPDGFLYWSLGDGGFFGDPKDNAQDLGTLLGAILRIDPSRRQGRTPYAIPDDNPFRDTPGARGEIWAYGLRNVWRFSWDSDTGAMWAGDVGQDKWEEVDRIVRGGNYGWRAMEGNHVYDKKHKARDAALIPPAWEYPRTEGISITGGHVYRGSALPGLQGAYLYADFDSGKLWALRAQPGRPAQNDLVLATGKPVASFGQDAAGEIYLCCFDGRVYALVAPSP